MCKKIERILQRGIIVSIQGYSHKTTQELADNAVNAGAIAIRTDKPVNVNVPIIGLEKVKVDNYKSIAYITPSVTNIQNILWADIIAIDYRAINPNLKNISDYCRTHELQVIADIGHMRDYKNIIENGYYYTFISTTMSIYHKNLFPDKSLVNKLLKTEKNIIAEGNYKFRKDVEEVFKLGVHNVCIGAAISDVYKLTRKYVTILC